MSFNDDLNAVLRYGLADRSVWSPIVDDFMHHLDQLKDPTAHQTHPLILADRLQDENDPRGELLRRSTGYSSTDLHDRLLKGGYQEVASHHTYDDPKDVNLYVYRHPKTGDRRLLMQMSFRSSKDPARGIHRTVEVTPDEAYSVVRHLPDNHKSSMTEFLRQRFGFRPTE